MIFFNIIPDQRLPVSKGGRITAFLQIPAGKHMVITADYFGIPQCPAAVSASRRYIIIMVMDGLFPAVIGTPKGVVFYVITAVAALFCGGFFICPACPPIFLYKSDK